VIAGTEIQGPLLLELGVIGGLWASAYMGARVTWRRIAGKAERRLRGLAEALADQIADAVRPGGRSVNNHGPGSIPGSEAG